MVSRAAMLFAWYGVRRPPSVFKATRRSSWHAVDTPGSYAGLSGAVGASCVSALAPDVHPLKVLPCLLSMAFRNVTISAYLLLGEIGSSACCHIVAEICLLSGRREQLCTLHGS